MRLLGTLVRLQIQLSSLKQGEKPDQWYDPSPLMAVGALRLDAKGASLEGGALDVHHADHPQSRQRRGENAVSVGFTGHYARMRTRFGAPVADGIAGENLIVAREGGLRLGDLERGVALRSKESGRTLLLKQPRVAHPCRPFSRFVMGGEGGAEALKEALQFLDDGMRGFYFVPEADEPFIARMGDEVFAL